MTNPHTCGIPLIFRVSFLALSVCAADQLEAGMLCGPADRLHCFLQPRQSLAGSGHGCCHRPSEDATGRSSVALIGDQRLARLRVVVCAAIQETAHALRCQLWQ